MTNSVKFLDKEHTEASLSTMSIDDLLSLRNLVASNLGVAAVKGFKDQETAAVQTWKALVKYDQTMSADGDTGEAAPAKAKKAPKEPKERKLAKPAEPGYIKRPTRKMFARVKILKEHTGAEGRAHRWQNYKDGMLIVDAIEGEGTLAWDIMNWASQGLMEVIEPTDEEYKERRAAWYKKHDREDPDLAKERAAEKKAKAKAEREAAAAAKKAAAAEAKAKAEAEAKAKAAETTE